MSEPRSELARYAFGFSDKKPGWLFWLIHLAMVAFVAWAFLGGHAQAQHCYSIWHFHEAQRCGGNNRPPVVSIAKREPVPAQLPPMPGPSFDIPLPDPDPATTALRERLQ
jgi:hypothetical protein